jgi:hypothetical protein
MISGTLMFLATKLIVEYVVAVLLPVSLFFGLMGLILCFAIIAAAIAAFVWYMQNVCAPVIPLSTKQKPLSDSVDILGNRKKFNEIIKGFHKWFFFTSSLIFRLC